MQFKYVFVPAESSSPVVEHVGDGSGGLQSDCLRLEAEKHFGNGEPQSVEILSLLLPCAANGFVGVSMYCDSNSKTKMLEPNKRATSIANICGYSTEILGDAFFGRYHDDESMDWERLDFGISDLSSDADWAKMAQRMNQGRNMGGVTTSGLLQNMLKSNNTAVVDSHEADAAQQQGGPGEQADKFLSWSQSSEEVEVKVRLPEKSIKAADLVIKIRSKHLHIAPKASLEPWASSQGDELHPALRSGADLWGTIDPDCSGWTLEKEKSGETTIILTLCKSRAVSWPSLTV